MKWILVFAVLVGLVQGCAWQRKVTTEPRMVEKDGVQTEEMVRVERCKAGFLFPMFPVPCGEHDDGQNGAAAEDGEPAAAEEETAEGAEQQ